MGHYDKRSIHLYSDSLSTAFSFRTLVVTRLCLALCFIFYSLFMSPILELVLIHRTQVIWSIGTTKRKHCVFIHNFIVFQDRCDRIEVDMYKLN